MIRRATVDDAREIGAVWVASWLGAYRGLLPGEALAALDVDVRAEQARSSIAERRSRVLVAEDEGGVYGFASLARSRDPDAGDEVGELQAFYVHPAHWGRGRGRALHDAALDELRGEGFTTATLWVLDTNERARRFYERQGWRPDGSAKADRVGPLRTPVEEVRYRREL